MIKHIYAYTGGTGSGKSYLAEKLSEKCNAEIYSFAHAIRQLISCTALGNYSVEDLKNGSVKKDSLFLNRDFAAVTKKLEKDFFIEHAVGASLVISLGDEQLHGFTLRLERKLSEFHHSFQGPRRISKLDVA